MSTNTVQLKVTLSNNLVDFLRSRASRFGLTMSSYVKNLIVNDVKIDEFPEYRMSKKTEEIGLKAIEEYLAGKAKEVKDVDNFVDNL